MDEQQLDITESKQVENKERDENGRLLPGHTANPNGRPRKGYSITDTIREMFATNPDIKQALGKKILEKALRGDIQAMKLLWGYMDGLPKQEIETNGDGSPIQIVIKRE